MRDGVYLHCIAVCIQCDMRERYTNVLNLVVFPSTDGGQIHLNPVAKKLTPTILCDRHNDSPCLTQPSHFLPQPASAMSSLACLSLNSLPLTFSLKVYCPAQDLTILSPQHIIIPLNTVFLSLSSCPHIAPIMDLSVFRSLPICLSTSCFTFIHNC